MADTSGEPPVRGVRAGAVLGGIAFGVVLSWFSFALVLLTGLSGDSEGPDSAVIVLGLSAVVGIALLAHPRSRQAGAGFLMGLAIGMITGAGVCGLTVTAAL